MTDLENRLRAALEDLAPPDPSTAGLAVGAVRYHRRVRKQRLVLGAVAALMVLVGGGLAATMLEPAARPVPAGPRITPGACPAPASTKSVRSDPVAAWICPDPTARADGAGWVLPAAPLTGRYATSVAVPEYGPGETCQGQPHGPAFILTLQEGDGAIRSYRSSESVCAAVGTLITYYTALADLEADARAAAPPSAQVPCRSQGLWEDTRDGTNLDSPFVAATLCFVPSYVHSIDGTRKPPPPIGPRSYRAAQLPADTLAKLNSELDHAQGSYHGNGECSIEGNWTYLILGRTASGHDRMLTTGCLDELHVAGTVPFGFNPSLELTTALRALAPKE